MAKKSKSKKNKYPKGIMCKGKIVSIASKVSKAKNRKGNKTPFYACTVRVKQFGLKFETFAILWAKAYENNPSAFTVGSKVPVEMLDTGQEFALAKIGFANAEGISVKALMKAYKASKGQ